MLSPHSASDKWRMTRSQRRCRRRYQAVRGLTIAAMSRWADTSSKIGEPWRVSGISSNETEDCLAEAMRKQLTIAAGSDNRRGIATDSLPPPPPTSKARLSVLPRHHHKSSGNGSLQHTTHIKFISTPRESPSGNLLYGCGYKCSSISLAVVCRTIETHIAICHPPRPHLSPRKR